MDTQTKQPDVTCKGLTFLPVPEFTEPELAFGPKAGEKAYFPKRDRPEVPREFEDKANSLFFNGGELPEFGPDVDRTLAARAIRAWLRSWAPSHESKASTVGYALWVWSPEAAAARASKAA